MMLYTKYMLVFNDMHLLCHHAPDSMLFFVARCPQDNGMIHPWPANRNTAWPYSTVKSLSELMIQSIYGSENWPVCCQSGWSTTPPDCGEKRIGLDYLHNIFMKQTLCQYRLVGCCDVKHHHLSQKAGCCEELLTIFARSASQLVKIVRLERQQPICIRMPARELQSIILRKLDSLLSYKSKANPNGGKWRR